VRLNATVAIGFIALAFASGCGSLAAERQGGAAASGSYPPAVARHFVGACKASARVSSGGKLSPAEAIRFCEEELECMERRLTLPEFVEGERKMLSGEENPAAKVLVGCAREVIQRTPR
jgi:hypothetical protein